MHTIKRLLLLLLFASSTYAQAWSGVLAASRAIDWSQAGAGTIPSGSWTQCGSTIASYTGTAATINTALAACGLNQYVLLGSGAFNLSTGVLLQKSNVVLRGSGPQQTKLFFSGHDGCGGFGGAICVRSPGGGYYDNPDNKANFTSGYSQGSTQITLSANTAGTTVPYVGAILLLNQTLDALDRTTDNGNIFLCNNKPACSVAQSTTLSNHMLFQWVKITSIVGGTCASGCTVNISPGLYMPDWNSGKSPQAWWNNAANSSNMGIENLSVDASADATANGGGNGIQFFSVQNGWVKNIIIGAHATEPVSGGTFRGVEEVSSTHITIRDSYFYGRALWDSYGTDCWFSGDSLVENNIFVNVPEPMMHETCWGNVNTYNFTVNNFWGNPGGTWAMPSVYHHGLLDDYVLSEGNIGFGTKRENYFGLAIMWTDFRNRYFGWQNTSQTNQTVPAMTYALNRYQNFVGNVLGTSGYHTNYQIVATGNTTSNPTSGCVLSIYEIGLGAECANGDGSTHPFNDTVVQGTLMRWGNYDTVNAASRFVAAENGSGDATYPALASPSSTLPASFIYSSKPSWWPTGKAWPSVGPDITGGNVGKCSGGTYDKWPATSASQCTGGSLAADGATTLTVSNPAMDCFFLTGGVPNGSNAGTTTFDINTCQSNPPPTVAAPSFSPVGGSYAQSVTVTISGTTIGAVYCFTTDGSTPTANGAGVCTHGTTYSTPITLTATATLQAVGSESGFQDSTVTSGVFTITPGPIPAMFTWNATPLPAPAPVATLTSISPKNSYVTANGFSQDGKIFTQTINFTLTGTGFTPLTICTFDGTAIGCTCATPTSCSATLNWDASLVPSKITSHNFSVENPVAIVPILQ